MQQRTAAFQNKYRAVKGLEKIQQHDADFYDWSRLYKVHSLQIFRDFDSIEWQDAMNLKLLLATEDESLLVELLFINIADFYIRDVHGISDFEIELNDDSAFGNQRRFVVSGGEGHSMGFYCRDIEVLRVSRCG